MRRNRETQDLPWWEVYDLDTVAITVSAVGGYIVEAWGPWAAHWRAEGKK